MVAAGMLCVNLWFRSFFLIAALLALSGTMPERAWVSEGSGPMSHSKPITCGTAIRPATDKELPAIARLAAKLVRQHHEMDPERFMIFEPIEPGYERYLSREARNPDAVVLAAVRAGPGGDEEVIGYAYGRLEPRDWNVLREACGALHDIFVDETARHQGVARALLEEMVRRLTEKGAQRIVLMTATGNSDAQRLFDRFGFRRTMIEMMLETGAQDEKPAK